MPRLGPSSQRFCACARLKFVPEGRALGILLRRRQDWTPYSPLKEDKTEKIKRTTTFPKTYIWSHPFFSHRAPLLLESEPHEKAPFCSSVILAV